ncbi:MAG: hypothetical protein M3O22_05300 [Pseudomonadota bacterium]|nr:hypothetical protein [Pseudomonadota bacterium]
MTPAAQAFRSHDRPAAVSTGDIKGAFDLTFASESHRNSAFGVLRDLCQTAKMGNLVTFIKTDKTTMRAVCHGDPDTTGHFQTAILTKANKEALSITSVTALGKDMKPLPKAAPALVAQKPAAAAPNAAVDAWKYGRSGFDPSRR